MSTTVHPPVLQPSYVCHENPGSPGFCRNQCHDVHDAPVDELLSRFNHLLANGGTWLFHGSLAFTQRDPAACLNLEELIEQSQEQGFALGNVSEAILAYMDCPDSRHGRRECVITMTAKKTHTVAQPARHQSLPDWISKGRSPVPLLSAFQSQAMSTRIHAFIMSLIDGKRSLKDIAGVMEEQQLMVRDDAETAIRGFLIKMFDETGRQGL